MRSQAKATLGGVGAGAAADILQLRALAVRQPWAWAIINAGKDVENRSNDAPFRRAVGETICIHASKHRGRSEYEDDAAEMMDMVGVEAPPFEDIEFGGVIGVVKFTGIVERSRSRWFSPGQFGLTLANPRNHAFVPLRGQVGLFWVEPALIRR